METLHFTQDMTDSHPPVITGIEGMTQEQFNEWKAEQVRIHSHPLPIHSDQEIAEEGYRAHVDPNGRTYYAKDEEVLYLDVNGRLIEDWPAGKTGNHVDYTEYDEEGYMTKSESRTYNPTKKRGEGYYFQYLYETQSDGQKTLSQMTITSFNVLPNLNPNGLSRNTPVRKIKF